MEAAKKFMQIWKMQKFWEYNHYKLMVKSQFKTFQPK